MEKGDNVGISTEGTKKTSVCVTPYPSVLTPPPCNNKRDYKGDGIFFFCFFLGILSSSCDLDMLEKLFSSIFGTGDVIFISFGIGLSNDGSDLFIYSFL